MKVISVGLEIGEGLMRNPRWRQMLGIALECWDRNVRIAKVEEDDEERTAEYVVRNPEWFQP